MAQLIRFYIYKLKTPNDKIDLSVTIGNGQMASTDLIMDGKTINADLRDSFAVPISDRLY